MNPYARRDGSPWLMREDAFRAYCREALRPHAGLVPGQSPAQPPAYPDRSRAGPGYDLVRGVAVVPVYGPIYRHSAFLDDLYAWALGGVSVDSLADSLRAAAADPAAASVLFTFDSPGGQVAGVGELAAMIRKAAAAKPVAAYVESMCCSAAYYLAAACGEITAAPGAFVGSIGTVLCLYDDSGFQEQIGVKEIPIVSSQSPDKWADPATDDGRAVYQKIVDASAAVFIADVARYRGTDVEAVLSGYGKGAVLIAADARRAGMVDKVGDLESVLSKMSGQHRARLAKASPAAATAQPTAAPLRVRLTPVRPGRA